MPVNESALKIGVLDLEFCITCLPMYNVLLMSMQVSSLVTNCAALSAEP